MRFNNKAITSFPPFYRTPTLSTHSIALNYRGILLITIVHIKFEAKHNHQASTRSLVPEQRPLVEIDPQRVKSEVTQTRNKPRTTKPKTPTRKCHKNKRLKLQISPIIAI